MADSYFPRWRLAPRAVEGRVVGPDERLAWPQTIAMGVQHVVAMFGSTVLAPLLMGFDPNLCIFMSGVGTLLFFVLVGGRVPSYLGSSFSFIGLVIAVTAYGGHGPNPNIPVALGGIVASGAAYVVIGLIVAAIGTRWIETLMPPVVTGAVVAVIGLNLAPIAVRGVSTSAFDSWMALVTVLCVGIVAVFARGMVQRLLILVGLILAYALYAVLANGMGIGRPIDFASVANAAWFGMPHFRSPVFDPHAMMLIAPVAVILVAENLGHIKAVSAMTGQNLDRYIGRAFVGDGLATIVFVVAAIIAIGLGFSPKFGALIETIPGPVLGGVSIVVFGLIAVTGARIWVANRVDFSDNRNLIVAAVTLVLGAGDFSLKFGGFALGGIGTATFGAIILYALLRREAAPGPVL
ncbi:pyrimidine utilization transport protein G [Paraburkholderia sp. NMBU_R16]|uniref:solute carrier family 23 protein n=1 Tax=Paraburkholderia sp. NMBU_R16 TaxID=2698676 RepID=UPI00156644E5|nr:solute carrier family 23 protein [Paraburkholderia sp. NMBU_R16]NRO98587.1 pyrimidine utilization transport protein G [Paraburkholderia sp. NMBU_R16]